MQRVHIDVEISTLDELDLMVAKLREETPGGEAIGRADLIRDVLRRAARQHAASASKVPRPPVRGHVKKKR